MIERYIRAFVAGSSFPSIAIPLIYMWVATTITPDAGFHYFSEVLSIATLFGLLNMLFIRIREKLPFAWMKQYLFFWACHWLFFSFLWNFWLNVPEKLFMLSWPIQYITIPGAMILYACIWRFIVSYMNKLVGLEKL